jgi:YVTN family beta-propeller protein
MKRFFSVLLLALPGLALTTSAGSVRIYQTNSAGDHVDVIDPVTNKVVMKVEGIEVPHGVVGSPDGTRAYISCESESTLWATDTKTGKLISKAQLSGHPNNISISNDGKYVFVGIAVAPGAVDVIDTASMKIAKTIPVKGAVHNTYVTPDGKYAVAGSIAGKMITVIDEKTLAVAWELPMDQGVRPMAFEKAVDGSTSRMFVQLSNLHGFEVVDFKTHKVAQTVTLPDQPVNGKAESGAPSHGIAVSPDGKTLWVNSSIASGIFEYSLPDLKVLGYVKTDKVPDWVTFTPDGKTVYVANSGVNMVSAVDVASRKEIARIPVGEVPKRNGTVVVP